MSKRIVGGGVLQGCEVCRTAVAIDQKVAVELAVGIEKIDLMLF